MRPTSAGSSLVDANQRTSNPRVFPAGDVSGAPQYVYVAAQDGHAAAAAGALGDPAAVDYRGLPGVTFKLGAAALLRERVRSGPGGPTLP